MSHELCRAFAESGLPLKSKLVDMLDEHFSHHTERRGCGYTQATRFLAERINQPRSPTAVQDLGVFDERHTHGVEAVAVAALAAGWSGGWRRLDLAPASLRRELAPQRVVDKLIDLAARVSALAPSLEFEESHLFHGLIRDLLNPDRYRAGEYRLPAMPSKPDIGSCSAAEEFFLEIAHGRVRRGGEANIVAAEDGRALLVEKMHLGESNSALSVCDIVMNGVILPAGSLFALQRSEPAAARPIPCGRVLPLGCIRQARFLRFTTLVVAPEHRERAFRCQLEAQVRNAMFSPTVTRLQHMHEFIAGMLAA